MGKKNLKIIGAFAAVAVAGSIFLAYSSQGRGNQMTAGNGDAAAGSADLIIAKSEINEVAKFYSYEAEGTKMELLAFRASDGTVRTAFNTCQICYDSGRGYYVQEGDVLVCQNCGNRYPADRVGVEKGGCNPIPIMTTERIEDEETITVSGEFIKQYKKYFETWKKA